MIILTFRVSFISSRFLISYSKPSVIYCTPGLLALCRHWFLLSKNPLPHWLLPSKGEVGRECFQFNCEWQNRWSFPAASGERLELSHLWISSPNIQIHGRFSGVLVYLGNFPLAFMAGAKDLFYCFAFWIRSWFRIYSECFDLCFRFLVCEERWCCYRLYPEVWGFNWIM